VDEVLGGFGQALNGPTPINIETDPLVARGNIEKAKDLLRTNGWVPNENGVLEKKTKSGTTLFSFSLITSDAPELKNTANILKETWEQIGAQIDIKIFEAADLSQNIIKGRKYDALLFGEVVGDNSDLYPFWHSSARNDPGLNVALYANIAVDKALEAMRVSADKEIYSNQKALVISEIKKDIPTIFLFSPNLIYVKSKKVNNILLKKVSSLNERFLTINNWFIETDRVWKIFVEDKIE
jgi:ABC-type transport system substrate-binding protein